MWRKIKKMMERERKRRQQGRAGEEEGAVQDSDETGQREGIKIKEKHGQNLTFNSLSLINTGI